jgi:hypothetical protein
MVVNQLEWMIQSFKDLKITQRDHYNTVTFNGSDRLQKPKTVHGIELQSSSLQIPPSPPPLSYDNFLDAKFWKSESWQIYCTKRTDQLQKLRFICDEDGEFVGSHCLKSMTELAKKLWAHLHHHRLAPATWCLISQKAYNYYSNNMCASFLEFQLCKGDWKASMFGTIHFPDWSTGARASGKLMHSIHPVLFFRFDADLPF